MSFEGPPKYRWVKMYKGVRYRVTCEELKAMVWTQEATWKAANAWWERKLATLLAPSPELIEAEAKRRNPEVSRVINELNAEDRIDFIGRYANLLHEKNNPAKPEQPIPPLIDDFLAIQASKVKPNSYDELYLLLGHLKTWWADVSVKDINEGTLRNAWKILDEMSIAPATKNKRMGFVQRFTKHLYTEGILERLPRNLYTDSLSWTVPRKKVTTWTDAEVKSVLGTLTPWQKLCALLHLNCGMTSADIGNLAKDMVKGDRLTRVRSKHDNRQDAPEVCYRLWPETLELLRKFESKLTLLHPKTGGVYFLTTPIKGTPWVESRTVEGKPKRKDLISRTWPDKCPIPLYKLRSVGANKLCVVTGTKEFRDHFLANTPQDVGETNYAPMSSLEKKFFAATDKVRKAFLD